MCLLAMNSLCVVNRLVLLYQKEKKKRETKNLTDSPKKHGRWRISNPLPLLRRLRVNAVEGLSEMTLNAIKS